MTVSSPEFVEPHEVRTRFSQRMSEIYKTEVPLYGKLITLVSSVNTTTLESSPELQQHLQATNELGRISLERHGAIRLGTAEELFQMRRFLALMGMMPTGYYDLTIAGLPIHSTCFRPHSVKELSRNPFRLFVSLLRLELLPSPELRKTVAAVLSERRIFSPRALDMIAQGERQGGRLTPGQADELVETGLETFMWHPHALVSKETYSRLLEASPLVADVAAFFGPHINHLAPRTLDIDAVQAGMGPLGIPNKEAIEGPPMRACPILLRQTSFKAQVERVNFPDDSGSPISRTKTGHHTARFGEIEQRGVALTPKGRALYDTLLAQATQAGVEITDVQRYTEYFSAFPDDWETLRVEGLAWFRYRVSEHATNDRNCIPLPVNIKSNLNGLVAMGLLEYEPLCYEDFLPISAAGIFRSNLGSNAMASSAHGEEDEETGDRQGLEEALGVPITEEMDLYAVAQNESLGECQAILESLTQGYA